jgi:hypothetical protein
MNRGGQSVREREHHPSEHQSSTRKGASGTSELRAVAEEAWDFGAHALHAARDWFNGRRTPRMRGRNRDDMQARRGARSGPSQGGWEQEHEGGYGRGQHAQHYGRAGGDRDQGGYRASAYERDQDVESQRGGMGRGARGGDAAMYGRSRDYDARYGDEYDDYGSDWPSAGMRDYGPAGYGSGAGFQREMRTGGGQRGYGGSSDFEEAGQGGYRTGYGSESMGRGAGGRSFNDRWENAYGGGSAGSEGYGSSGGYASAQHQGYGRESTTGLGRRGRGPKNYIRSDERIREDISERLSDDDHLDASEIEVQVSQGVVTLTGTVEERWEKHRAEDIAGNCSGVRDVLNQIRVGSMQQSASMSSQSASQSAGSSTGAGLGTGTGTGTGSRPGAPAQTGSTSSPGTSGQSGASSTTSRQN